MLSCCAESCAASVVSTSVASSLPIEGLSKSSISSCDPETCTSESVGTSDNSFGFFFFFLSFLEIPARSDMSFISVSTSVVLARSFFLFSFFSDLLSSSSVSLVSADSFSCLRFFFDSLISPSCFLFFELFLTESSTTSTASRAADIVLRFGGRERGTRE